MNFSKLTKGDRILGGAGIVFLISTFLPWFSFRYAGIGSTDFNGWDVGFLWGTLPFLLALGMLVWIGLRRFSSVALPADIPPLYLIGGALVLLLPLLRLLLGYNSVSRSFGLFVAVLAGAGVAFGGFLKFTEGGGKLNELKAQVSGMADQLGDKAKSAVADAKDSVDKKD